MVARSRKRTRKRMIARPARRELQYSSELLQYIKSLFAEMAIKAKCRAHALLAHDLKAHAVHQAQFLACRCEDGPYAGGMHLLSNPFNVEQRYDIFVKSPQCRQP